MLVKQDKDLLNRLDRKYSWHPFTQMKEYMDRGSLHLVRGEGVWLYDIDGRRYLDGNSSNWSVSHGHNVSEIKDAIKEQLDELEQCSYKDQSNIAATLLCEQLVETGPEGVGRVFYTDNGSCAIECASKMSVQYWQMVGKPGKIKSVGISQGYHGDTVGAMSMGKSGFHTRFKEWFYPSFEISAPECIEYQGVVEAENDQKSLGELEQILEHHSEEIAFMVMEPSIMGPNRMTFQPKDFVKKVERLCKKYDVHLMLDEIFVGLGRVGALSVARSADVKPDFVCLSKGLTGGYLPFGATLTTETIYEAFYADFKKERTFFHGHTFAANPIVCAASLQNMKMLRRLVGGAGWEESMKEFGRICARYFKFNPYVKNFRQRGFVCAFEVTKDGETFDLKKRVAHHITLLARKREILLRGVGNTLFFVPPFVISPEETAFLCKGTSEAIVEFMNTV